MGAVREAGQDKDGVLQLAFTYPGFALSAQLGGCCVLGGWVPCYGWVGVMLRVGLVGPRATAQH